MLSIICSYSICVRSVYFSVVTRSDKGEEIGKIGC